MKKMVVTIDVQEDFGKGQCYMCPLANDYDYCILGYDYNNCKLKEDNTIRFVPCKCGRNSRTTIYHMGGMKTIRCRKCGYEASGNTYTDAKRKWVKGVLANE